MKKNRELIILFIIVLLFGLYKIINVSFSYDTDVIILNPKYIMLSWIGLMRYGLTFIKYVLHLYGNVNIRLLNILTYVNVFIYSAVFLKFLSVDGKKNIWKDILTVMLVITSPILLEQYNFTLQSVEVSFSMILMMISFITTYKYLKDNKIGYACITILLLIVCFSTYQSFVNLYILGVLISLYKLSSYDNKKNITRSIIIFMISFILYYLIGKVIINIMNIDTTAYLTSKIGWLDSFKDTLFGIGKDFVKVLIGYGHVLNLGYLLCVIIVIGYIIKNKNIKSIYLLFMLLVPFLLNTLTGSRIVIRSLFTIPFLYSFIFYEFFDKKYVKYILIVLIISQLINSYLLLIGDYHRYLNDISIGEKIYNDCGSNKDITIYIYGVEKSEENISLIKGEVMGYSYYEWFELGHPSYERIHNFMIIHNIEYNIDNDYNALSFDNEYPNNGYIIKEGNKCYVNLGD